MLNIQLPHSTLTFMVDFGKWDYGIGIKIGKQIKGTELVKKQTHIYMIWCVE